MMAINNRYEFVILFDVENGNPNGDPDFANNPRTDIETGHGIVTDVCLKRKIRNYVELVKEESAGYKILIKTDKSLNAKFHDAYIECGIDTDRKEDTVTHDDKERVKEQAKDFMCKNYFDVRAFGAVMSTGSNPAGTVRGPIQINFARSISPVTIEEITITRQAKTTDERLKDSETEFGRKSIISYALYRAEGYVSAALAGKTGLSDEDLDLVWEAIVNMFEHDHSAARGKMIVRELIVFKHDTKLGCAPSHILFDKVQVRENTDSVPRAYSDYIVEIDPEMPKGVEFIRKL